MQYYESPDKMLTLYLKRKHKLYRTLVEPRTKLPHIQKNAFIQFYQNLLNKDNPLSEINFYIKHTLQGSIQPYLNYVVKILLNLLNFRSGSLIAFIVYRLCRREPQLYWLFYIQLQSFVAKNIKNIEQVNCLTDLFLYGFPITQEQFQLKIFPFYQNYLKRLLPKYWPVLDSHNFLASKTKKQVSLKLQQWLNQEKNRLKNIQEKLIKQSKNLQKLFISSVSNDLQQEQYTKEIQIYETNLVHYQIAAKAFGIDLESEKRLKSIFQLRKQCKTFRNFELSPFEKQLYTSKRTCVQYKNFTKNETISWQQSGNFMGRIKMCSRIQDCYDLSGYFLQQMNKQTNRELLVQNIINQCYKSTNLPYMLKIVFQISQVENTLKQFCCQKVKKICNSKTSQKYNRLMLQLVKFQLCDQQILLGYLQKLVKYKTKPIFKEVQMILQGLGALVYYRNLQTHNRINKLFEQMQAAMKDKVTLYNMEDLFHLKGLHNYLITHSNSIQEAQSHEIQVIDIKNNFQFARQKLQKMLQRNQIKQIIKYVCLGVESKQFLQSYYYASLISQLNNKILNKTIAELVMNTIDEKLKLNMNQQSVQWSRFLGQLYSYQLISRKKLSDFLLHLLNLYKNTQSIQSCLKTICAALQTSKSYLLQDQKRKQSKQFINLLLNLKETLLQKDIQAICICEVQDILDYFCPQINHINLDQIKQLLFLGKQGKNIYFYLNNITLNKPPNDDKIKNNTQEKIKYKQKIIQKKDTAAKKTIYVQKIQKKYVQNSQQENQLIADSNIFQQRKDERQQKVKKNMRVIGRSKGLKTVILISFEEEKKEEIC